MGPPRSTSEGLFAVSYLYVALAFFVVVYVALHLLNDSRTGRAWRSLREDPLAAELMGMPVNRLKLMAFAFGASVAALTGTFTTALNGSVFPQNFEFPLLITVYTMVILGGAGSQAGVVVGAVIVSVLLEALRDPGTRGLFYVVIVLALVAAFRTSLKLAVVLGGTIVFGLIAHLVAGEIDDAWTTGPVEESGRIASWAAEWVIVPAQLAWVAPVAYIGLIALALALTLVEGWARIALMVPTLYLAAFVWENVMLPQPESTRYIVLGALLVAMMIARPQGLLGEKRVEIVVTDALLDLQQISMSFGGLKVVDRLDLHVDEGEIVSVIGPNGAGKTTLFNLVTGVYVPVEGDIVFEGTSIKGLDPHRITRCGIARTFQTLRLFLNMTVRENVMAAAYGHTSAGPLRSILRTPGQRREEREIGALAEERLAFFGERLMGYRWDQPAYSLSYANRRRLEIARATATNPRLLLLDEPAAGMNPKETQEITELIGKLREEGGYTILVIEHDMHVVEGISDRVVALDHGVKIAEGTFEAVATDPRVVEAYLGTGGTARK